MQKQEFINRVQQVGQLDNKQEALHLTEAYFTTLGQWLYRRKATNLATELPQEFQDLLFAEQKLKVSHRDSLEYPLEEFYERMGAQADIPFEDAVRAARAVTQVMEEAISPSQMEMIKQELSQPFIGLFPR